jgi:hypothetical protein
VFVGQHSGGAVAGPFGAAGAWRSGSYIAPSGATYEYAERSGGLVGPLGGVQSGGYSYEHYESADRGYTYSRYSRSGTAYGSYGGVAVGPYGGVAVGQTTTVVGPYGGVGYRRSAVIGWP